MHVAASQTEILQLPLQELSSAIETGGTVTVAAAGESLQINMAGQDTTEPYSSIPDNATEVIAFEDALDGKADGTLAGTLTLRDYVPASATISLSASAPDEYAGVTGSATVAVD